MENEVNDTPVLVETENEIMKVSKDGGERDEKEKRKKENNLERANQIKIKNPTNDMMENEVNDTPVKVETESEVRKVNEVVHIPEGSQSPSVSSMKRRKEIPIMTRPDIYKNGACPPP